MTENRKVGACSVNLLSLLAINIMKVLIFKQVRATGNQACERDSNEKMYVTNGHACDSTGMRQSTKILRMEKKFLITNVHVSIHFFSR